MFCQSLADDCCSLLYWLIMHKSALDKIWLIKEIKGGICKVSFAIWKLYQSSSLPSLNKGTQRDEKTKGYFRLNKDTALVFNGNLIVIQNAKTYSSAGLLVSTIVDNNLGIVIGGKSSYKPCHYGDLLYWMLPNTNVKGCISHKIFIRPDAAKCGETTLLPTVQLESTWKDVVSGADVCWEWILSH